MVWTSCSPQLPLLWVQNQTKPDLKTLAAANYTGTILDSGASCHFPPGHLKFLNYQELVTLELIRVADGLTFSTLGKGDLQIKLPHGD